MKRTGILMFCIGLSFGLFGQKVKNGKVPYKVADRYFVNNNVKEGIHAFPKITSQEEFDKLFGMATVMGENGQPTPIDFSKQYVIALIDEANNRPVTLEAKSLSRKDGEITFTYQKTEGETASSAYFRHCLIVIVDNKYEGEVVIKDSNGEEYVPYILGRRYYVKNTVEEGLILKPEITDQEQFDELFGAAAVMGEGGLPTSIDFSKQYVIAVINESTDGPAEMNVRSLTRKEGTVVFTYQVDEEVPKGPGYRYCIMVVVDKKYSGKVEIKKGKR